ncbi:fungal-specific transcription factor domain-containing protein [Scheffersomyces coipomensis]|uniref:fungal-specific transcription factor domain-containing protein n=1 Tax=Scheffersomyces coipomensis TaxID=1788519 RepID=UPI00315C89D7
MPPKVKVESPDKSSSTPSDQSNDNTTDITPDSSKSSSITTTKKSSSTGKNPDKPKAFTIKYKRPRGSRACTVCRSRKVRCDAEIHIPCTNCITFGCDCILPEAKKRGNTSNESKNKRKQTSAITSDSNNNIDSDNDIKSDLLSHQNNNNSYQNSNNSSSSSATANISTHIVTPTITSTTTSTLPNNITKSLSTSSSGESRNGAPSNSAINEPMLNISQVSVPPSLTSSYKNRPSMHKKELLNSKQKASLTFLGHSSIAVVPQKLGDNHIQLTEDIFESNDVSLDSVELEILKLRGAFLLPSHDLSSDLINSYFEHVHPLMPVINRTEFMKKFNDPNDNPSLMLLQAVLLCGCRVTKNPLLLDSKGSNNLAALTFFRRAKALYETNYESDPVSIIQTLILIGSYWEGPEDVTKNSFYWTRVAVGLAQGFGFQRDVNNSTNLTNNEKKIWRRIWWCLFEKDRNVAIAFGRPSVIDLNDCDVPMLTIDDFNEDEEIEINNGDSTNGNTSSNTTTTNSSPSNSNTKIIPSPYPLDETQALYFIHLVKLAEITGIIIKHQYSVKSEQLKRKNKFSIIQHCDMLMGIWFTNLPPQLVFSLTDTSTQNFYSCLLNAQYYNRLYLIHRSNLIRMAKSSSANPNNYKYPSWGISFQAARMISLVSKILLDRNQIKYCPVMFVYILFSALVMLIYHVDSANTVISSTASDSLLVSRAVLKELSNYWPIARVLMKLFDKYANDKIKRAKVIENGNKIAEYQELSASQKAAQNQYYDNGNNNGNNTNAQRSPIRQLQQGNGAGGLNTKVFTNSPGNHSTTSGVSPGGGIYNEYTRQQRSPIHHQIHQPQSQSQPLLNPTANLEELVHQIKRNKQKQQKQQQQLQSSASSTSKNTDNSPASSTQSFPDVTLVTENLPTNQNFFENFDPTQLFPDIKYSYPPTRAQSPGVDMDIGPQQSQQNHQQQHHHQQQQMGSNVYSSNSNLNHIDDSNFAVPDAVHNEEQYPPTTPGGTFNTNFIDSSFINMNLQSGIENNYLGDDLSSLFNLH